MSENITVSRVIPARPERIYNAWLDADEHGKMIGSIATSEADGRFTAWDGYIEGRTVSAVPHSKLVQSWRTTEFPEGAPDSTLTVLFEPVEGGTQVTVVHEQIPEGQGDAYEQGWREHYFTPMKAHFSSPLEQVREVSERITQAVEEVRDEALEAVDKARGRARKQAVKAVQAVKKAQKQAASRLKGVSRKVKALVKRGGKKKPAAPAKKKARPAPRAKPAVRKAAAKAKPKAKARTAKRR